MSYSKEEFAMHMKNWNNLLNAHKMPAWNELPAIDLYMDQVLVLMNQYIVNFPSSDAEGVPSITPPMINNYVKLKAMPAPQKKKYSKIHLAYLIMICSLKQALSIPTIQKILPLYEDEEKVRELYEVFSINQLKAFKYITEKVCAVTDPILNNEADANPGRMYDLAVQIAVSSNVFKMLSEDVASIQHLESNENSQKENVKSE